MKQLLLKTRPASKKNFKVYVLRVNRQFSTEASLFLFGGLCDAKKNLISIKEEADKAFRAGYKRILLPWNFVFHPEKHKLAEWIVLNPRHFILAVHKLSFKSFQKLFSKYKHTKLYLELNLESYDSLLLQELENSNFSFYITIPAHKKMNLNQLSLQLNKRYGQNPAENNKQLKNRCQLLDRFGLSFKALSKDSRPCVSTRTGFRRSSIFRGKTEQQTENSTRTRIITKCKDFFFKKTNSSKSPFNNFSLIKLSPFSKNKALSVFVHFPCSHQAQTELYNSKEMYDFLKKSYYPPPPYDIYNLSIPKDLKLEPENKPELVYDLEGKAFPFYKENKKQSYWNSLFNKYFSHSQLKASVIITAYNCERELALTLEHLYQQDLPKNEWELIVVDDGSQKKLSQSLKTLKLLQQMNFKFIFLPRDFPRTGPKDHRFRA
ncbi:MAG: glycosyltransferase, partial [Oligoflexia bacterium]|nr:glycosyltransferase [Oligoflexia bacterium]